MNLRGRITLIVTLSFVAFVGLVVMEGRSREAALERRLESNVLTGLQTTWVGLTGTERQRLLRYVGQIRNNREATVAFAAQDSERLAQAILTTRTQLRTARRRTELQAVRPDGTPFLATEGDGIGIGGGALLPPEVTRAIVAEAQTVDGLFRSGPGELVYALAAPFYDRGGVAGLLVLATPAAGLVEDLGGLFGASSLLADPAGRLETQVDAATRPVVSRFLGAAPDSVAEHRVRTLQAGERHLQLAQMVLTGPYQDGALGRLITLRDVSAQVRRSTVISQLSYFGLACALVLFLASVNWYLRRSFRPLTAVVRSLKGLSEGHTGIAVPVPARDDEIGRLAGTFETFRQGIEARAQLSRLQQELDLAAEIQRESLPSVFPKRPGLAFAARMQAAREVGGDFYDVFALPDGRIACVIADVSGKGIGAALFMAVSRTVIRTTASLTPDPGECLRSANDRLAAENSGLLFVTVFYAVLDPQTGELRYCNAGHNPPAVVGRDGEVRLLDLAALPALGVFDGLAYETGVMTLHAGERLFLYTDGITEAMTDAREEFGEARMRQALAAGTAPGGADPSEHLLKRVLDTLAAFTAGAEQNDDITCLAIAYDGV